VLVSSRDNSAHRRRLAGSPARGFIPKSDLSGAAVAALVGSRMCLLGVAAAGLALAIAAESVTYLPEDSRLAAADATVGLPKSGTGLSVWLGRDGSWVRAIPAAPAPAPRHLPACQLLDWPT
jgi:hypothetical protein